MKHEAWTVADHSQIEAEGRICGSLH